MTCRSCGSGFPPGEEAVHFAPFVVNQRDPLLHFSGESFHRACLDAHPLGALARRRYQEFLKNRARGRRFCAVCGGSAEGRSGLLEIPHLVADPAHELDAWNEALLHLDCIPRLPERAELAARLRRLRDSPDWEGGGLDEAIDRLEQAGGLPGSAA